VAAYEPKQRHNLTPFKEREKCTPKRALVHLRATDRFYTREKAYEGVIHSSIVSEATLGGCARAHLPEDETIPQMITFRSSGGSGATVGYQ
jgi:hypothetical protein